MYGLWIATFANAREWKMPALWHTGGRRCKIGGRTGRLEWHCCHAYECWRTTTGWTVGTGPASISGFSAADGVAAAGRPGVGRRYKWDAGAGNIFSDAADAQATAAQPASRFSGGRSVRRAGWPFACGGLCSGNGAIE